MKYDSLQTFMLSVIELKLDLCSMFAWQNHSKDQRKVPQCTDLLDFIDLHAEALENIAQEGNRKHDSKKSDVNLYMVNIQTSCVACNANINYIKVGIFAPCLTTGKSRVLTRMLYG